ncbi:hypothetical protein CHISP_2399 [Chitinispirillum alkaliphilum]|nr:hypothetical protein CHISP_2399 [Chitinispirillum alkaliphilum]
MMEKKDKVILVTGASGKQGGSVAHHLLHEGWKVRALTRNPQKPKCKELESLGAEVVMGDLNVPSSLEKALKGVYGVFSVEQPLEHGVEAEIRQGIALAKVAEKSGVEHFVYSSIGSADQNTGVPFFDSKAEIEEFLRKSNLSYTILRPVYFMENLMSPSLRDKIYNGTLELALRPDVPVQVLSVDDLGAIAAMVFADPHKFTKTEIELAGDELTGPEMAGVLSKATGRPVEFKELPIEQVRSYSADYAMMYDWLNLRGFSADISELQNIYPNLATFEDWVQRSGWHRAAA